jgi:V/A-type H+-transporting ATPase subunit K
MKRLVFVLILIFAGALLFVPPALLAQETAGEAAATGAGAESSSMWKYIAAAAAVGISCIAGGIAVGQIGSAAMGAMSENPELSGKALPYAGLAEGICLWGFLVALLILVIN